MSRSLNPEKRSNLLDAALRLFVANGVGSTSTAEIARAAGVAAGTLFLYFPTKQELVDALALQIGAGQSAHIQALLDAGQPARQMFYTIWEGTLNWFLDHLPAYQYLQQVRDSGLISAAAVQESARYFAYYFEAIQKGLAEGSLKPYPAALIGDFLYHDLAAVMPHLQRASDPALRPGIIRQGFDIFWDGIRSHAHSEEPERPLQ
jgi:AcrR family transcriptional regulator